MSLDPSQLSLPQIAAAVVAGDLRLIDAEAELRRRPEVDSPRWLRLAPPPPPRQRLTADVLQSLDETRRELRKATRQLSRLTERLDQLTQLAASAGATATAASPPSGDRAPPSGEPGRSLPRRLPRRIVAA
jgi:hypothetical protein